MKYAECSIGIKVAQDQPHFFRKEKSGAGQEKSPKVYLEGVRASDGSAMLLEYPFS